VSRLADFCSTDELTIQTGHAPSRWALVVLKELCDNALDACEEAGIPPEITIDVSTSSGQIVISDNGPGIPVETIQGVIDFANRTSSRAAYVSPTRGSQGNALKTVLAMAFVLDGRSGETLIETSGQAHRIIFEVEPLRRIPRVLREIGQSE